MSNIIEGRAEVVQLSKADIINNFGNMSDDALQHVADIVATYVESADMSIDADGYEYVEICSENFNDCFDIMMVEIEEYLENIA